MNLQSKDIKVYIELLKNTTENVLEQFNSVIHTVAVRTTL